MSDYNIGNIYAELSMDTSNLEASKKKAIKELGKLREEGERILKEGGGKMTEAMKIRLDEIEKNKREVLKSLDDLNKQIKEKLNPQKEILGNQIETVFMQPLKAFASSSIDTFTQFQQSMQNTFSVMGASANDMKLLEESAKKMGETTRFSASQASSALYALGSAGQSAAEAVKSLQGVLNLAGATGSDLAYTSETITSTLSQFNLEASKASHIADVYAKAISKSQANMTKLAYSMKYVGPVASGLGISLETTTAALMKLYNTGYGGEQAGTYLKQAFQKLASGTQDLKSKLEQLGICYEDVNPQTRNFANIINTLKEHNIGVTESISIFGETAGGAMAKLIEEGGDAIATMEGLLKSSEGAAKEMQDIQNASFANTKAELLSAMEAVQITTGSILEPMLNTLAEGFTNVLKNVNALPVGFQTFITTMLTASTAIVPFLTMPALITKIRGAMELLNVSMLHNPIFISGAVLSALASIAYSIHTQVKKKNEEMVREATKGVEDIKEMQKKAQEAGEKGRSIQGLLDEYERLRQKTNKTKEEQQAYNKTLKQLTELVPDVVVKVGETGDAYIENATKIKTAILEQLQLSKQLKNQALEIAKIRYKQAQTVEAIYKAKAKNNEKKDEELKNNIDTVFTYSDKINELKKKGQASKKEIQKLLNDIQDIFKTEEITIKKYFEDGLTKKDSVGYEKALENFDNFVDKTLQISKHFNERKQKDLDILLNTQKTKSELEALEKEVAEINKLIGSSSSIANKLQTKDEIAESLETNRNEKLQKLKKDIKRYRENTINFLAEERALLVADLKTLFEKKSSEIEGGKVFEDADVQVKKIQKRIDEIDKLTASKNISTTKNKDEEKLQKQTLYTELEALDSLYNAKIEIAKKYGKEDLAILKEHKNERLKLLQKYAEKEGKEQSVFKNEDAKNPKNLTSEEQAKKAVTIQDEIEKTEAMALSFLEKNKKEYEQKKKELAEILKNISKVQAELEIAKATESQNESDFENIKRLESLISSLQSLAKGLSDELGKNYVLLADIDSKIEELDQKDTNSFIRKLLAIKEEQEVVINAINKAKAAGNIDENTALKKIREINAVALKSTVTVGAELSKTILSVGNNVTDIILNAIDRGMLSISDGLNMAIQIGAQLADMIPDPMTKAIVGAIQIGFSLINKLVDFAERKVRQAEEKEKKRREAERKESEEKANKITGDISTRLAKQTQAVRQGLINYKKMIDEMTEKLQENKINDVLKNMGNKASLYNEYKEGTRAVKAGWFFGLGKKVLVGYEKYLYEYNFTINELIAKIKKAKDEGNKKLQKELEGILQKSIDENLKKEGINPAELNGFHNYLQGLEGAFVEAVRNKDFERLHLAMKEKIRQAMWAKLQESIILSKLKPLFMELEQAGYSQKDAVLKKIMKESEDITKELDSYANKVFGKLGGVPSELEKHQKAWSGLKMSITEALSSSLEEAAYNADWSSFKKAFAGEMKKAIIRATLKNAGLKTSIDEIIKDIMKDGEITQEEINNSIGKLQGYFDELEGKLAPLAKVTKALEGGVDVKSEHKGTIIQQLSGADRDFFAEEFRKNFTSMSDSFKSAMIDLKEIHQAKITVQMATLNVNDIYINATNALDLKELIAQMIEEAQKAG